jgi:hypothetical protein
LVQRVSCGLRDEEVQEKSALEKVPYNAFSHLFLSHLRNIDFCISEIYHFGKGGVDMVPLLIILSFFPLKGSMYGVKLVSFSRLPDQFAVQLAPPNWRIGMDVLLDISDYSVKTFDDTLSSRRFAKSSNFELGFLLLRTYGNREFVRDKWTLSGLIGLRPFFSYFSSKDSLRQYYDTTFSRIKTITPGIEIKGGTEFNLSFEKVKISIQLLSTIFSISRSYTKSYIKETEIIVSHSTETEEIRWNVSGIDLFRGGLEVWVYLRL